MPAGADRTRLAGTILSGRSVAADLGQGSYDGWYKSGFGAERDRALVQGSRPDGTAVGVTAGMYKPDVLTLTFLSTTAQVIREYLATLDPLGSGSYGNARFITTIRLTEPDIQIVPVILWTFTPCFQTKFKVDLENTSPEAKEDMTILFLKESCNGVTLWNAGGQ